MFVIVARMRLGMWKNVHVYFLCEKWSKKNYVLNYTGTIKALCLRKTSKYCHAQAGKWQSQEISITVLVFEPPFDVYIQIVSK